MRMEDLDAGRAKPESVQQAYDDLRWLGMDWDAYGESHNAKGKTPNEVVQSERQALYAETLEQLLRKGAVYPCTCTRADIAASVAASANAPHEGEVQPRYPGTCRGKFPAVASVAQALEAVRAATGKPACFRLRVPAGRVTFDDVLAGPQSFDVAADAGDFPLTRFATAAEVPPAYQLACVVDDHAMGIDLVIRGDDLLPSTPRQLLLYAALGAAPPRFAHVPLVIGQDGKRLAKRHGESRIAQFRAAGVSAERVVGWVAWRSGQIDQPREISAQEMLAFFNPDKLPRDRIVLNQTDLDFLSV
jgi:glutamyl-tRNA synthetase